LGDGSRRGEVAKCSISILFVLFVEGTNGALAREYATRLLDEGTTRGDVAKCSISILLVFFVEGTDGALARSETGWKLMVRCWTKARRGVRLLIIA
jgi:hypothetical protein